MLFLNGTIWDEQLNKKQPFLKLQRGFYEPSFFYPYKRLTHLRLRALGALLPMCVFALSVQVEAGGP